MKSLRTKACDISKRVKQVVWERDGCYCVLCGNPEAMPNAHFIPRSHGGLGIEENIVTLCINCHRRFDQTSDRSEIKIRLENYLKSKYPNWNEKNLIYKKGKSINEK